MQVRKVPTVHLHSCVKTYANKGFRFTKVLWGGRASVLKGAGNMVLSPTADLGAVLLTGRACYPHLSSSFLSLR